MLTWPDDAAACIAGKHFAQAAACGLVAEERHSGDSVFASVLRLSGALSVSAGNEICDETCPPIVSGPMSLQGPDTQLIKLGNQISSAFG
jgi:hypothetical protein